MASRKSISFQVDHLKMGRGIYIPAIDEVNGVPVTTFDIRVCKPYTDPTLTEGESHTIEHMLATGLRAVESDRIQVLYFGPMGCMTGFYLLLAGSFTQGEAADFIAKGTQNALDMVEVPARNAKQCGNYLSLLDPEKVQHILRQILGDAQRAVATGAFDSYPA